jgi:uncharacterized membrane protein
MQPKRTKYDTNPLEENVAQRAGDSFSSTRPGPPTEEVGGGPTRDIGRTQNEAARSHPEAEAETRHIGDQVTSYPSVVGPPKTPRSAVYEPPRVSFENIYQPPPVPPPSVYQPPPVPVSYPTGTHKVAGLGIPEKWAVMLPYLPFSYLGIVAAIIELALVPRTESRVRFHAAQALGLQLGITIISILLTFAGVLSSRSAGAGLFNFASFIFLIIAMIRAWKGKPLNLPPLDEPRKWLDEKINPRK